MTNRLRPFPYTIVKLTLLTQSYEFRDQIDYFIHKLEHENGAGRKSDHFIYRRGNFAVEIFIAYKNCYSKEEFMDRARSIIRAVLQSPCVFSVDAFQYIQPAIWVGFRDDLSNRKQLDIYPMVNGKFCMMVDSILDDPVETADAIVQANKVYERYTNFTRHLKTHEFSEFHGSRLDTRFFIDAGVIPRHEGFSPLGRKDTWTY